MARRAMPDSDSNKGEKATARTGPKLAFRLVERGKAGDGSGAAGDDALVPGGPARKRRSLKDDEQLRNRRSFTVEELAALAALAGTGLQATKAAAADGLGVAAALASALGPSRKLGLAEKVLLKALLEPAEAEESFGPGPELQKALGLVVTTRTPPPPAQAGGVASAAPQPQLSRTEPPPPPGAPPSNLQPPPPPPGAPASRELAGATANADVPISAAKRTVDPSEWPPPSAQAVQQMLARFPQLDGHCRGSLMNLPPQFALAILWDMDAKGGPEEIRDPQAFVFSAAQTLLRLPPGAVTGLPVPAAPLLAPATGFAAPPPPVFAVQ
ncbi:CYB2 [Symbiodinium natans]|uniref:CYB2 protein n=1 Tax=Symbiodinium natans TaxID=878477 RepID=A0A812KV55_9DINO|nr:CYB2 [Symbiodinium natans]